MADLPPVVADPDMCHNNVTRYDTPGARVYGPHDWELRWRPGVPQRPAVEVCRFCGGRKP